MSTVEPPCEDRPEWCETDEWVVPTPTLKPGDRVAVHCGDDTYTFTVPRSDQEPDMTATDRHDELVALLNKISEESVTTSNVLADMLDLLRERLPEYVNPALDWLDEPTPVPRPEPAPADDGLAEWERELLRPATCCGKCPPIAGGGYDCTCEGNPRAEKAEAERDASRHAGEALAADRERLGRERNDWRARHAALRGDVEALRRNPKSLTDVLMCIADALDHDDERGEQG